MPIVDIKDMSVDDLVKAIQDRVESYQHAREIWYEGGTSQWHSFMLALDELASRARKKQ